MISRKLSLSAAALLLALVAADKPAEVDFDGVKTALATIPTGVLPADAKDWTVAKADVANDVFTHQVMHKTIRLQVKVTDVTRAPGEGGGYVIVCSGTGTDDVPQNLVTTFFLPPEKCLIAARLNIGDTLTLSGEVDSVLFNVSGSVGSYSSDLHLDVMNFNIESQATPDAKK